MTHPQPHICAALPKLTLSAHVVFCRTHQAWTYTLYLLEVDGDEVSEPLLSRHVELGPFDGLDDVAAALHRALEAAAAHA